VSSVSNTIKSTLRGSRSRRNGSLNGPQLLLIWTVE